MGQQIVYDITGIGIGPFNLGLAALSQPIENLKTIFFDQQPEFNWHPGLLLKNAKMQVPFYADLVTLADPRSAFSYFSFLHAKQKMFRFGISEQIFTTRNEYNEYCKWVVSQMSNLHFGMRCEGIEFNNNLYEVSLRDIITNEIQIFKTKHIVIGTGTVPNIPACASQLDNDVIIHSSKYLFHKKQFLAKKNITIIGSGQSAAEIFYDLLQHPEELDSLKWFTRSDRFYAMEYSKLTLEMTSPDYVDYFYSLDGSMKSQVLLKQNNLYKGINYHLINEIYDVLHEMQNQNIRIHTNHELRKINDQLQLDFFHTQKNQSIFYNTNAVILATGYKYETPNFLQSVKEQIQWSEDKTYEVNRNYSIDKNNSIFVQNADLHSHGFNSADLGMGPYRNATILNTILKKKYFVLEKNIAFQHF
jgi:putrescine N-hydroxylase